MPPRVLALLALQVVFLFPAWSHAEDAGERHEAYWAAVREIYNQRVTLVVDQKPLAEVAELIAEQTGLPVLIDRVSLDDFGIDASEKLSGHFEDIPLHEVLRLLLRPIGFACSYDPAYLTLMSEDEAEQRIKVRVYPVRDLLGKDCVDFDSLLDVIVSTIESESWAENGGGEAEIRPLVVADALVISQTILVHLQIEDLLEQIRWAMRKQEIPPGGNERRRPCFEPWNIPGMGGAPADGPTPADAYQQPATTGRADQVEAQAPGSSDGHSPSAAEE